ncbi:helix-turn-helix transcriptional regulator [Streptomyces chartreusis]|uniref:helix-turn-helix transcriptional regulator n=1 Tax=Streptomyces chartreusis TaxID=1969 RepID=UPI00368D82F5
MRSVAYTDRPGALTAPNVAVLLALADAVHHRWPVSIRYSDRGGRRSERVLHPHGIVAHADHWHVTGQDAGVGEDRTFRLDRIPTRGCSPARWKRPRTTTLPTACCRDAPRPSIGTR